jgi:hypothetical protein
MIIAILLPMKLMFMSSQIAEQFINLADMMNLSLYPMTDVKGRNITSLPNHLQNLSVPLPIYINKSLDVAASTIPKA